MHYKPARHLRRPESLLFVPPFAEEMNRSRRVVALQAEALAAIGLGVLVLDLFGCGDSGGDFGEATWEQWLDDVSIAAAWLEQESQSAVGLWGLRLGASLAALAASRSADRFSRLLLWSPVARGQVFLTQFLRARVAMALSVPGVEREGLNSHSKCNTVMLRSCDGNSLWSARP